MQEEISQIMNRLSEHARFAFQKADFISKTFGANAVATEHLLLGILSQPDSTGAKLLQGAGVTASDVEKVLGQPLKPVRGDKIAMMALSEACVLTLSLADGIANEYNIDIIGTEELVLALLGQPQSRAVLILRDLGINIDALADKINEIIAKKGEIEDNLKKKQKFMRKGQLHWLARFGKDLTESAKNGELDAVIGRNQEIERVVTVLCRRTKSNPVLIGEAGVGKTAIVEGLATRIAKNDVPGSLVGKRLIQVDLSSLVAGTKFRGEFEERIKGVIDEACADPSILLFIDEIHLLCGAGSSTEDTMDAANILKPALARGNINLIGATTLDEYRRTIEKDKALERRFQTVIVNEPSPKVALQILKGVKTAYEKHHGVLISDDILETAINMSVRYINDRFLPDKAIDVIDEASAIAKVAADKKGGGKYKRLKIEQAELDEKAEQAAEKEDYESAAKFKTASAKLEKEIKQLEKNGAKENETPAVTEENLATAISLKTGIPVSKVHGSELKLLSGLESHLQKSVISQDEAISAVAKAIRRGRSGVANPNRPIGSFLFMGPTGVGKTELARVIAREVFGGENALIKIDMSEFGEKHNVSRLVGAPAGYIGYNDGGKLTEAVRRRPYSVVLFDEIEKAHPDVFNLLLQILEDGTLTDGQGNKIKFNNTIVILTSNLGAESMYDDSDFGFSAKTTKKDLSAEYENSKAAANRALKKSMRPELINRLDAILVFRALTEKGVEKIFDNLLDDFKKRLNAKKFGLVITPEVKSWLIKKGYDPKNGARPLRRAIEDNLESLVSDAIISGELQPGNIASVSLVKNNLKLDIAHE